MPFSLSRSLFPLRLTFFSKGRNFSGGLFAALNDFSGSNLNTYLSIETGTPVSLNKSRISFATATPFKTGTPMPPKIFPILSARSDTDTLESHWGDCLGLLEVRSLSKVSPISFTTFILSFDVRFVAIVATFKIGMVAREAGGIKGVWGAGGVFGFTIQLFSPAPSGSLFRPISHLQHFSKN